jgi:hypothetical protein
MMNEEKFAKVRAKEEAKLAKALAKEEAKLAKARAKEEAKVAKARAKALAKEEELRNIKRAICITLGEQSENHHGMEMNGDGLAERGYSNSELEELGKKLGDEYGIDYELLDLGRGMEECGVVRVLVLRNCMGKMLGDDSELMSEMVGFDWDKTFFDTRRRKVLNKHARYNVCFGDECRDSNMEEGRGSIIGYARVPLVSEWKGKMEDCIGEEKRLEMEGNLYFDVKKCGIGFHGDGERKKVIAVNICDEGVEREIHWRWYKNSERVGEPIVVTLRHGDCYVMSEKASGFDWKKRKILTLRHAAAVHGSKYLR